MSGYDLDLDDPELPWNALHAIRHAMYNTVSNSPAGALDVIEGIVNKVLPEQEAAA